MHLSTLILVFLTTFTAAPLAAQEYVLAQDFAIIKCDYGKMEMAPVDLYIRKSITTSANQSSQQELYATVELSSPFAGNQRLASMNLEATLDKKKCSALFLAQPTEAQPKNFLKLTIDFGDLEGSDADSRPIYDARIVLSYDYQGPGLELAEYVQKGAECTILGDKILDYFKDCRDE